MSNSVKEKEKTIMPLFDEEGINVFPTNNIKYPKTVEVPLKNGKPKESWMQKWSEEERIEKIYKFWRIFDLREEEIL